jgi:hypothetical protein
MSLTSYHKKIKKSHLPQPSSFGQGEKKRIKLFRKQPCLNSPKAKGSKKGRGKTRSNAKSY